MDLGFACNAPMSMGLSPIRLADRPPPLPPFRAGGLIVHRQPRSSLSICLIRAKAGEAKEIPAAASGTVGAVSPDESASALGKPLETGIPPARLVEFDFVLTPIRATMIAFNLAIGRDEIIFPGLQATSSLYDPLNHPVPYPRPEPPRPCPIDVCG